MLQGLWSILQNYLDMLRSIKIKILCSAFKNNEAEDCNPNFQLGMEYGETIGFVTGIQHFCIRTHISLQIF